MEQGMYIIAGLGNPGREYEDTRHNVGFRVLEKLAKKENISVLEKRHKAIIGKGVISGRKCILAKPQTYMNLSGESVRELADYYKIDIEQELIVIYDDINLEPGQLRIREKGSAGGHNGIKNMIACLGSDVFARVRIGVGKKPEQMDLVDHVLGHFAGEEQKLMEQSFENAARAVEVMLYEGTAAAMNLFNRKNL